MPEKRRIENSCRSSEKREVDDEERDRVSARGISITIRFVDYASIFMY